MTVVSPGRIRTDLADSVPDPDARAGIREAVAIEPAAIAFAIEQPDDVDVGDTVVRPTAQA